MTCAGHEIGWHFDKMMQSSKTNFTAFTTMMNHTYDMVSDFNVKFMDPKTYRQWWFSWASHQKIDFRQVCYFCGENPPALGSDATRIGMTSSLCQIDPIERFSNSQPLPTTHRKFDRSFILSTGKKDEKKSCTLARKQLKEFCDYKQGLILLTEIQVLAYVNNIMLRIPAEAQPLFTKFVNNELNPDMINACISFFGILSTAAPLRTIIPTLMQETLVSFIQHTNSLDDVITTSQQLCPEIGRFITVFCIANGEQLEVDAANLIIYILEKIRSIHVYDVTPMEASPIPGSYNPAKFGRAYYFRPDGLQIRQFRQFNIDARNLSNDDHSDDQCTKRYPMVKKNSTTFLFLWFCPIHGHCYGFHIVNGSEGRKDPACSLYNYLENPPRVVYYDFACGLDEYFCNRESGYIKDTRFYHDIFHSYGHKCGNAYKSQSLTGMKGYNSSIMEQFNNFAQCIKGSARQMSQVHFVFYVQYMINIWNQKKLLSFRKKLKIGLEGSF